MRQRTFRQYLISFRHKPEPVGDLADDYMSDWHDGFRPTKLTPLNLYQRLEKLRACSGAYDTVIEAAKGWAEETGNAKPYDELRVYVYGDDDENYEDENYEEEFDELFYVRSFLPSEEE